MTYQKRMTEELVAGLNQQIKLELQASYLYLTLATHCAQSKVALPGFQALFTKESMEERDHAQQVIDYQVLRGNTVSFCSINLKDEDESEDSEGYTYSWDSAQAMVTACLNTEKAVTDHLYGLLDLADKAGDHHAEEWLEDFLDHQMKSVHEMETLLTQVKRVGEADGLYALDVELLK